MAEKKVYYGGQAVIEGVMMRGKENLVVAVRRPNGEIGLSPQKLPSLYAGKWRKTPLIRGIIVLIESLVLGIQTLMHSANVALEEEKTKISGWGMVAVLVPALAFAVGIFFLLPLFITNYFNAHFQSSLVFNLVEGLVRVAVFIIYLWLVGLMKDIRRVFAYHGAEHKTVNAYENGAPLEVDSVRKFSTAHVRCGTSFLFAVMVIAILVFSLVGKPSLIWMIMSRILLIPVIASLGYEFVYFSGRHTDNPIIKLITKPGLWIQTFTTRVPDDKQIEVAVAALRKVVEIEETPAVPVVEAVSQSPTPPVQA
jgi:uncharacterized protein YqhQ